MRCGTELSSGGTRGASGSAARSWPLAIHDDAGARCAEDDRRAWVPRVRKLSPDGRVAVVAAVERP